MVDPSGIAIDGHHHAVVVGSGNATVNVGLKAAEVERLILAATQLDRKAVQELSRRLEETEEAALGFLRVLNENEVPPERLGEKLNEIAGRYKELTARLASSVPEGPVTQELLDQARVALSQAEYDRADNLLREAEEANLSAAQAAEEKTERLRQSAADTRSQRGDLEMLRLRYLVAAEHFEVAARLAPVAEKRIEYLRARVHALYIQGDEKGDNSALLRAITASRELLLEQPRERVPLDWAAIQNNLGNALARLGERESGTERLEEAVTAYKEALKEYTRGRVPLQWATIQNNLETALSILGERESGTERLEEAVTAYKEALKELESGSAPHYQGICEKGLRRALDALDARRGGALGRLDQLP